MDGNFNNKGQTNMGPTWDQKQGLKKVKQRITDDKLNIVQTDQT